MTIEEIKSKLTIIEVIMQYGLLPDRQGRLCCPFHEDTTPSFQLYPKTNTWHCFSSNCNAGTGDVIDFVMKKDNSNKYQAIMKCKSIIQQLHPEALPVVHHQVNSPVIDKQEKSRELEKIFSYFKNGLTTSSLGRNYLASRGLDRAKLQAASISIGYNSGQFHLHGSQLIECAVKQGLLIPSDRVNTGGSGYNIWAKVSIVFPLLNKQGNIISLYARGANATKNNKHFYLKESEGLFPSYPKADTKSLLITESVIDAATLQQHEEITKEFTILAAYGTNRLTDEHLQAIKELPHLQEIVFYFDGDAAGIAAVKKYATTLKELLPNVTLSIVQTLEEEDVNSIYCKYGLELIAQQINTRVNADVEATTQQAPPVIQQETIATPKQKTDTKKKEEKPVTNNEQTTTTFTTDNPEALVWQNDKLHVLILGGIKLSGLDRLKVTLKIKAKHNHYTPLRHNIDLYNTEHLLRLKQNISEQLELSLTFTDISFNELIEALENYRLERIGSLQPTKKVTQPMTTLETDNALTYLKHPELMHNTMLDIGRTGIVGEENNRLTMLLVFASKITSDPLHIISFGASGTGKTYLQENVAKLIPDEDKLEITTLSGNALYYFKNDDLKNKLLLIEDYDGVQDGLYPLRELSTKQKITKTVSLKDSKGNIKTYTFTVEGPVSIAGCTTKESVYEDNANRCILLYLDTSAAQDERIMEYQRKVSAGLINYKEEEVFRTQLRNVLRMIKPVRVVNPYAPCLKIPKNVLKPRRSHRLYLRFIEVVTLYNQYQREIKINTLDNEPYIETTFEDIAWANKLLKHILIRKADELTTACRAFLERLKKHLKDKKETTFKAKDIRGELRIHASSLKKYLLELYNNGYIKQTGGNKQRGYLYEIASYEEYETLKSSINNALDSLLENIKKNGCKGTDTKTTETEVDNE